MTRYCLSTTGPPFSRRYPGVDDDPLDEMGHKTIPDPFSSRGCRVGALGRGAATPRNGGRVSREPGLGRRSGTARSRAPLGRRGANERCRSFGASTEMAFRCLSGLSPRTATDTPISGIQLRSRCIARDRDRSEYRHLRSSECSHVAYATGATGSGALEDRRPIPVDPHQSPDARR